MRTEERAGADVRPGVTVTDVQRDGRGRVVRVQGHDHTGARVELGARWVIGVDGLRSRVARSVGAPPSARAAPRAVRPVRRLRRHPMEWVRILRR